MCTSSRSSRSSRTDDVLLIGVLDGCHTIEVVPQTDAGRAFVESGRLDRLTGGVRRGCPPVDPANLDALRAQIADAGISSLDLDYWMIVRGGRTGRKLHLASRGKSSLRCGHWTKHNVAAFRVTAASDENVERYRTTHAKHLCEKCFG